MEDGRVIPLLLDIDFKEISGPLAQFQAKKAEMAGIKELVMGLNKVASVPVPEGQLDKLFNALWADLERQLNSVPKMSNKIKQNRPQEDILEELVSSVRGVEIRVREVMDEDYHLRNRKRARIHPRMMVEFINDSVDSRSDPINILVLASVIRDEIPWFYEIALDTYRILRAGSESEIQKASRRYLEAIELVQRGPFTRYLGIDESLLDLMKSSFFDQMEMRQRFDTLKQASTDQIRMRRRPPPPPPPPPSKTE